MGDKLGLNFDELGFIPTQAALKLFNEEPLYYKLINIFNHT